MGHQPEPDDERHGQSGFFAGRGRRGAGDVERAVCALLSGEAAVFPRRARAVRYPKSADLYPADRQSGRGRQVGGQGGAAQHRGAGRGGRPRPVAERGQDAAVRSGPASDRPGSEFDVRRRAHHPGGGRRLQPAGRGRPPLLPQQALLPGGSGGSVVERDGGRGPERPAAGSRLGSDRAELGLPLQRQSDRARLRRRRRVREPDRGHRGECLQPAERVREARGTGRNLRGLHRNRPDLGLLGAGGRYHRGQRVDLSVGHAPGRVAAGWKPDPRVLHLRARRLRRARSGRSG